MFEVLKKVEAAVDSLIGDKSGKEISRYIQEEGVIDKLRKSLIERALEGELSEHLGYKKHDRSEESNSRNGVIRKQVSSEHGVIDLEVPRDREGSFAPQLVKKRQSRIDGIDEKILSLYSKGMSQSDIKIQLRELYGIEVSESLVSRVTDEILEEVRTWQNRSLESVYPIVFFDCLVVKVRHEQRVVNKSVYVALGVESSGHKDILGLWGK